MDELSTPLPRRDQLTGALLGIVAHDGLEHVSVREVAAAAGVSIGTVQHYFPTKDDMLAGAFEEMVRRIRARMSAVRLGDDIRHNLRAVLRELLPLDDRRATEVRIQLAFSARAATSPRLAAIQRGVLDELLGALAEAFALGFGQRPSSADARRAAHVAMAATDGLALHAVSAPGWLSPHQLNAALDLVLDSLLLRE